METMLRIVEIPEQISGKERPLTPPQDYVKSIELIPGSPIRGKTAPAVSPPVSPLLEPGSAPTQSLFSPRGRWSNSRSGTLVNEGFDLASETASDKSPAQDKTAAADMNPAFGLLPHTIPVQPGDGRHAFAELLSSLAKGPDVEDRWGAMGAYLGVQYDVGKQSEQDSAETMEELCSFVDFLHGVEKEIEDHDESKCEICTFLHRTGATEDFVEHQEQMRNNEIDKFLESIDEYSEAEGARLLRKAEEEAESEEETAGSEEEAESADSLQELCSFVEFLRELDGDDEDMFWSTRHRDRASCDEIHAFLQTMEEYDVLIKSPAYDAFLGEELSSDELSAPARGG
jgi:hypothetical protein